VRQRPAGDHGDDRYHINVILGIKRYRENPKSQSLRVCCSGSTSRFSGLGAVPFSTASLYLITGVITKGSAHLDIAVHHCVLVAPLHPVHELLDVVPRRLQRQPCPGQRASACQMIAGYGATTAVQVRPWGPNATPVLQWCNTRHLQVPAPPIYGKIVGLRLF
jgi:hypothetical protein